MGEILTAPPIVPLPRRRLKVLSYATATAVPIGLSKDRKTIFGSTNVAATGSAAGTQLYESTDDGATWTSVGSVFPQGLVGIRETDDGEAIAIGRDVSFGYVYKSTGWSTSHATATWSLKLQTPGGYFKPHWNGGHAWSFGDDTIMAGSSKYGIINSYGPQTTGSGSQATKAVFIWLTSDYGATWTQVFDLSARYPNVANIHVHATAIDCYVSGTTPRLIATYGDTDVGTGGATGNMLAMTSDDLGATWQDIPSAPEWSGTYRQQTTAIAVLEDCVMLLNDSRGGPWRLPRKGGRKYGAPQQVAVESGNGGEILISQGAFKAPGVRGAPLLYAVLTQDTQFSPCIYLSPDGLDFAEVWRDDNLKIASTGVEVVFGPTYNGKVVARVLQATDATPWLLRAELPQQTPVRPGDSLARTEYRVASGSSTFTAADVATRTVTDGATTSGSATFTSATGAFTAADVGKTLTGTGIPASTVILSITNTTTVAMSANATATGSSLSVVIGASYQDVQAANLTLTFTAPASGRVEVTQTAAPSPGGTTEQGWNVRDANGDVAGTGVSIGYNSTGYFMTTSRQIVPGLVPGNVYTWKWGFARLSGTGGSTIQVSPAKPMTYEIKAL